MIVALAATTVAFLATLVFHFYSAKSWTKERNRLQNAFIARSPQEFALLNKQDTAAEKKPAKPQTSEPPSDIIAVGMA